MDRPAVLLLTDDLSIARAIEMLLRDWGFDGRSAGAAWDKPRSGPGKLRVAGILVDMLGTQTEKALAAAVALRERAGAQVPILIQSNNGGTDVPGRPVEGVTILPKPVDPARIRAWLNADGCP